MRAVLIGAALLLPAAPAAAAPGDLDPGFGQGGTVTTTFGGDDVASDLVVQPDGRIVVVGWTTIGGGTDFAVARYLPDGQLDPSFSGDGKVTTDVVPDSTWDRAAGVALQADGKIVVGGGAQEFTVARYNPDGTLDDTFSDDGLQTVPVTGLGSGASDVAIDSNGKIVLVGTAWSTNPISNQDAAFVRLLENGDPDPSYWGGGTFTRDLTGDGGDNISAVAPLPDGTFIATGFAAHRDQLGTLLALVLDGVPGAFREPYGESKRGRLVVSGADIEMLPDGRAVIVGGARSPTTVGVVRLLHGGGYDPSFSGDGEEAIDFLPGGPGFERGTGVAVQPTGRIVESVSVHAPDGSVPPNAQFALARFRARGGIDTSFAEGGRQATDFGPGGEAASEVALQGADRIVAAGTAGIGTGSSDFALARYDGSVFDPDPPGGAANRGPDSNIRKPARRLRAGRPIRFRGTASDDAGVAKVEVALLRVAPARKGRRVCRWLRNRRSQLSRKVGRPCVKSRKWLRARGTRRWSYRLRRGLPAGRYVLFSRATDTSGAKERRFSARDRNRLAFRVRRRLTPP